MNTDPSASRPQCDLVAIAANPNTDLEILRTLAYEYPHLRPVIALNPSSYEGLLQWLGDLGDEDVNAALRQRAESGPVFPSDDGGAEGAADGADAGSDSDVAGAGADSADARGESDAGGGDETEVLSPVAGMPAVQQPAIGANRDEKVAAVPIAGAANAGASNGGAANSGEPDEEKRRSTQATILILAVVAIALVALVIYFATRSPATDAELTETESPTEAVATEEATEAPTEPEETTEEPTEEPELKYPAPDGTSTIGRVAAPSGNIVCQLTEDAVTCTVFETNDGDAFGEKCEDGTVTVQATADGVGLKCDSPVAAEGMASVDYGNFGQFGNVACGSQFNGVSCWNQETGQGFGVSRQGWTTTDKGFIAEDSYPWFE